MPSSEDTFKLLVKTGRPVNIHLLLVNDVVVKPSPETVKSTMQPEAAQSVS